MELVKELEARGLVQDSSAPLQKILGEKRTVYVGTDPTADSLHVGHLAWVILLKRLADSGHKIILLVGGGTGMIGDPKEKGERTLKSVEEIDQNAKALESQLGALLGEKSEFLMVNNAKWLREINLLEFLRDVGKHFTVNELVKRDLIKRRLENPDDSISYTEFTYSLLQAYDYWELNQRHDCDLQIGGSDQWTNILSGVDLIRKREGKEVFAFSLPLITDSTGRKFGKSEGNAVWLDSNKTSSYQFYQFWFNLEDDKVEDYLKIYTELSIEEIEEVINEHKEDPSLRVAQKRLAEEVTRFVHGIDAPKTIARVSEILFGDTSELSEEDKELLSKNAPVFEVGGEKIVDVLVSTTLAKSKREAREFVEAGAVTINGEKITDPEIEISGGEVKVLKRGKRNAVVLK